MRFAVSLLVFVCVASLIGTVLTQNQDAAAYIDQFGPFWFSVFGKFSIYHIYNSWWFLLIMMFLVVSTSICLTRNTPKMLRDARSFREYIRTSSLRAFHHRVECASAVGADENLSRIQGWLRQQGYRYKLRQEGDGTLVAAKRGGANRLGYIFTHAAIVIVLLGGLLDSQMPIRVQIWLGLKKPITQNMLVSQVPASGRLSMGDLSFRANMLVPEGSQSSDGLVSINDGVLVQPLPFIIKLKRFYVSYYSTGMPSDFRSDVEIIDPSTGKSFDRTIEVNEPLRYKGLTIYQSSFDDGGSKLRLMEYPLVGAGDTPIPVDGTVGKTTKINLGAGPQASPLSIDLSGLRTINVEDMSGGKLPQPKPFLREVAAVTGSAARERNPNLRNVGPSVQYRIIGRDGQSHEFNNYMQPITLDGISVFLAGVREAPGQSYRYLRIPADADHSVAEFMRLRAALNDPAMRAEAAARFAAKNSTATIQGSLLAKAAQGALETFAKAGFNGIVERAPVAEREKIMSFAVPMIQLSLTELRDIERAKAGLAPIDYTGPAGAQAEKWIQTALLALANLPDYPAPVFMSLQGFHHIQASVFQVARSPGTAIVLLGCLFLVIGIFSMFFIRERRIWVWVKPAGAGSELQAAMTSQRRNIDFERDFENFKNAVRRLSM
ncbi:MAG: cytochrome c biogenesis protein ResB [Candidimonas sp.]|nr:MAG: cytochrome c biogenesis protein ResB [Candidimonas sp.]